MGLKKGVLRGSKDNQVNSWGHNIALDDPAHACANCLTLTKWGNPHGRTPGPEKVTGGFHQPLRLKNTILLWMTDSWSGCTRKLYSKLNSARVCANHPTLMEQAISGIKKIHLMTNTRSELYVLTFFKHQSHTLLCKSPNTDRARQFAWDKA